jgi:hypothetical protein
VTMFFGTTSSIPTAWSGAGKCKSNSAELLENIG